MRKKLGSHLELAAVRWFDGSRVCIRIMCFRTDGEAGGIRKRVQ